MKTFIMALVLTLGASLATAQDFRVGLKGGLNVATWSGDDSEGADPKIGLNIGTYLGAKFTKVGIEGELLYSTQGTKVEDSDFKINNDYFLWRNL